MDKERIKQMAVEAGAHELHGRELTLVGNAAIERLILAVARECAEICSNMSRIKHKTDATGEWRNSLKFKHGCSESANAIRARFGLGE